MSTISPAVEARFRNLASQVPNEDWEKLVVAGAEHVMKRLANTGVLNDANPAALKAAYEAVGATLVDLFNVVLTSVASGIESEAAQALAASVRDTASPPVRGKKVTKAADKDAAKTIKRVKG